MSTVAAFAYRFFSGSASVTVPEPLSWSCVSGDGNWENSTGSWDVSLYPGENKSLIIRFHNASSADIVQAVLVDNTHPDISLTGGGSYTIAGGGNKDVTFILSASQSIAPGAYSFYITVDR